MSKDSPNGLSSWFNTPYFHILYKEIYNQESQIFLETLTNYLNLPEQATILDLGCGRGQNAIYLNTIGYDVTGVDLLESNITYAKNFKKSGLKFDFQESKSYNPQFDAVFNLFNNYGYINSAEEILNTIKAIKANLNDTGFGVIDFMNSAVVIENLVAEESKTIQQIDFKLKRFVENDYIVKDIMFEADGETHQYQECVKSFSLKDFESLFEQADTYLLDVFGDYKLNKFRPQTSERLVMIFK